MRKSVERIFIPGGSRPPARAGKWCRCLYFTRCRVEKQSPPGAKKGGFLPFLRNFSRGDPQSKPGGPVRARAKPGKKDPEGGQKTRAGKAPALVLRLCFECSENYRPPQAPQEAQPPPAAGAVSNACSYSFWPVMSPNCNISKGGICCGSQPQRRNL